MQKIENGILLSWISIFLTKILLLMLQFLFSPQSTFGVQTLCYYVPLRPGKSDRSFTEKQIIAVFTYYEFTVDWSLVLHAYSGNGRLGFNVCGILVTARVTSDIMLKQAIIILYLVNRLFFCCFVIAYVFRIIFFCFHSVGYRGKFSRVIKGMSDFISFFKYFFSS